MNDEGEWNDLHSTIGGAGEVNRHLKHTDRRERVRAHSLEESAWLSKNDKGDSYLQPIFDKPLSAASRIVWRK